MLGIEKLYSGDWNNLVAEQQLDGSQLITLSKDGENKVYRFRVKNLYQENEDVLEDEEVKVTTPDYILKRAKKAREALQNGKAKGSKV